MHLPVCIFSQSHDMMKLRPVLILLLFAASAGILAGLYAAASRPPRTAKAPPWAETLADLDACGRRKHVKSLQYDNFATIAAGENRPEAERLFRAMAYSERLQEHNCAEAILHLGGSYTPPVRIVLFGGTTDDNLERSIAYERRGLSERHGAEIDRAIRKGNRYAARILARASALDLRNAVLMERCMHAGKHTPDSCRFFVCPKCGNIYAAEYLDYYCPLCLTHPPKRRDLGAEAGHCISESNRRCHPFKNGF